MEVVNKNTTKRSCRSAFSEEKSCFFGCDNKMTCLENMGKNTIEAHSKVKIAWSIQRSSFNAKVNWCEMSFFILFERGTQSHLLDEWTKLWVLSVDHQKQIGWEFNITDFIWTKRTPFFVHHLNRTPRKTTSDSFLCNLKMPPTPNPQPLAQQTQTFSTIEIRTLLFAASKQVSPARPLLRNNGSCHGWSQGRLQFPPQTGLK